MCLRYETVHEVRVYHKNISYLRHFRVRVNILRGFSERGDKQRYIIKCRDFQATREVGDFPVTQVSCEFYIEPIANQGQCVLTRSWRKQNEIFSNYFTFIIGGTQGV